MERRAVVAIEYNGRPELRSILKCVLAQCINWNVKKIWLPMVHASHTFEICREQGTPSSLANAHNMREAVAIDPIVPNISIMMMSDVCSLMSVKRAIFGKEDSFSLELQFHHWTLSRFGRRL